MVLPQKLPTKPPRTSVGDILIPSKTVELWYTSVNDKWGTQPHNLLVAHHQNFKLLDVVHKELLEASWQHVFRLIVATITDVWHQHLAFEAPADPVVNTSGFTPVFLKGEKLNAKCSGIIRLLLSIGNASDKD